MLLPNWLIVGALACIAAGLFNIVLMVFNIRSTLRLRARSDAMERRAAEMDRLTIEMAEKEGLLPPAMDTSRVQAVPLQGITRGEPGLLIPSVIKASELKSFREVFPSSYPAPVRVGHLSAAELPTFSNVSVARVSPEELDAEVRGVIGAEKIAPPPARGE